MTEMTKNSAHTQISSVIAEFKKGKIVFKQKPLPLESLSETLQEIVRFRDYVQMQDSPLSTVPQDHLPLIAKLVQESDKSLTTLTKSLLSLLFPTNSSSPALSDIPLLTKAVEEAIKKVAERVNYGVVSGQDTLPSSCAVWRWEVKDYGWLPESVQESALTRLAERKQAKEYLQSYFEQFSEEDKNAFLGKKNVQKASVIEQGRPDKKSSKVIKEKREAESTKKSAAAFANFFLKNRPIPRSDASEASSSSKTLNDFESTFKPFLVKKGVRMFPSNWFVANQGNRKRDLVQVDDETFEVWKNDGKRSVGKPISGSLRSYFPPDIPSLHPICQTLTARRQFREQTCYSVRSIVNQLNEAELQGDHNNVRKLLATLKDRKKIPIKVLSFSDSNRPAYLGTWTRTSSKIGPRKPFALDLQSFDYDHDSDAEWEVDETGEDVDSEGDSMDEEDNSSVASDLDDWLVDSDVAEEHTLTPDKKRKIAEVNEDKFHHKKRKVIPLVPFQKGPIWEKQLGVCEYDLFDQMRIQMFNDIPVPLNPFEDVSMSIVERINGEPANSDSKLPITLPNNVPSINLPPMDASRTSRKQNGTAIPKTTFPDTHIEALFRKITPINTNSFAVLVDALYQDLRPLGIKKNALEVKLREVTEKDKELKTWKVKESAWAQYGLNKEAYLAT